MGARRKGKGIVVAVDFGTTFSGVAWAETMHVLSPIKSFLFFSPHTRSKTRSSYYLHFFFFNQLCLEPY